MGFVGLILNLIVFFGTQLMTFLSNDLKENTNAMAGPGSSST